MYKMPILSTKALKAICNKLATRNKTARLSEQAVNVFYLADGVIHFHQP